MNSLQWMQVLVSYSIQAAIVIGAAWAIEGWVNNAQLKTRVWSACYLSLLILLCLGLLLPRLEWFHPWSEVGPNQLLEAAKIQSVIGKALLALWLLGVAAMVVRWTLQAVHIRQFVLSCPRWDGETLNVIKQLSPPGLLFVGGKEVQFRRSPEEYGPFCYQLHQPIVFLPISIVGGEESDLRYVLQHELTHLATQHPLQVFMQKLVQTLLWFHPLVWISGRRAIIVREFVCDDASSDGGAATASYLRTLLRIVERQSSSKEGTLTIGRTGSELRIRASRLVMESRRRSAWWASFAPLLVVVMAGLMSQCWLPTNPLASSRASHSPWPAWSASVLHMVGVDARDFEQFEPNRQLHELMMGGSPEVGDK